MLLMKIREKGRYQRHPLVSNKSREGGEGDVGSVRAGFLFNFLQVLSSLSTAMGCLFGHKRPQFENDIQL